MKRRSYHDVLTRDRVRAEDERRSGQSQPHSIKDTIMAQTVQEMQRHAEPVRQLEES